MARRRKTDVLCVATDGLYMFYLRSRAAMRWVKANVHTEPWQWQGDGFAVDGRSYAMDIAQGMLDDGLNVV